MRCLLDRTLPFIGSSTPSGRTDRGRAFVALCFAAGLLASCGYVSPRSSPPPQTNTLSSERAASSEAADVMNSCETVVSSMGAPPRLIASLAGVLLLAVVVSAPARMAR